MALDAGGDVWFNTSNSGVARLHAGKAEFAQADDGSSSVRSTVIFVDREGSIWVGCSLGLQRFHRPLAYLMSTADGMPPGMPKFVYVDSHDRLWMAADPLLARLDLETGTRQTFPWQAWPTLRLLAIGEDREGRIWLSDDRNLYHLQDGRWVAAKDSGGAAVAGVLSMKRDDSGDLWAISTEALYRIVEGKPEFVAAGGFSPRFLVSSTKGRWLAMPHGGLRWDHDGQHTEFTSQSGLAEGTIHAICEDRDSLWFGAGHGLSRWRNGKWTSWTAQQGIPGSGVVWEIAPDSQGRFWLMTFGGILLLNLAELDQTPDGMPRRLEYLRIGALDHVNPHTGGMASSPRIARDHSGRFYFDTLNSVAVIDPAQISLQSSPPPIVLENVLVNRQPAPPDAKKKFVRPDNLEFEYTSLSLRNPENVRFRYRLEGHDKDWVKAGSQRRAVYGRLKPGSYRFHVIGSGSDGSWNHEGASYQFSIVVPFYVSTPLQNTLLKPSRRR